MYTLLIFFFLIAIFTSFLCSLWEAVLLSITPSYAQIKVQEGSRLGHLLQAFKEDIDRPLAAILTLNTIAHTAGAIGVGDQASKIWAEANPLITGLAVPVVMTLAILVLSELIPKTLGANYWKELAPFTARSLALIIRLLAPLVWFSRYVTKKLKKEQVGSAFTRSDFLAMADIGAEDGVFERHESDIIRNLLRFRQVRAQDVMTPRTVLLTAPDGETIGEFLGRDPTPQFSRIPLYEGGSPDQVIGYMLKDELLARMVEGGGAEPLDTLRRDIITVPRDYPITELFSQFLAVREHIALVVDEFGGTAGIVTMEDIIETLLGVEIVDESDEATDMQLLARRHWEHRAKRLGVTLDRPDSPAKDAAESDAADGGR
ncbi:CBS domain-containing protein [Thioflavicoccus mobilis 8321]|uniref:CBS domain-containing protein n=1 Tax=Thioflavicoccus mobilis 8321 TaxID=765912 RepID=L0H3N0_9GAMM|nr:hemolysin family protein [Thioflavicoccus mobilis]AGA92199.1 CBS domain-containing protein [Thioflavicoccus mobilis 8321]